VARNFHDLVVIGQFQDTICVSKPISRTIRLSCTSGATPGGLDRRALRAVITDLYMEGIWWSLGGSNSA